MKLTNKEYHKRSEIGCSDLKLLIDSPYKFLHKDEIREETTSMLIGSLVHKLILEPEDFDYEYVIAPEIDKRTNAGKEELSNFLKTVGQRTPISKDLYLLASEISKEVLSMKETANILKNGEAEQSYFTQLEGIWVKARPDFYNEDIGLIVDIKTTQNASPMQFMKTIANYNYHIQTAFYIDVLRSVGKRVNNFLFLAIETKKPYLVGFYELDEASIEFGREQYKKLIERYKFCKENNLWWGYAKVENGELNPVQTITLPTWKFYEEIA